jgi:double zinc ribbon protein
MFCANCACELPAVAKFCVRCGSTIGSSTNSIATRVAAPPVGQSVEATSVRCLECGGQNPGNYSFCTTCGVSLRPISSPVFVSSTATAFGTALPSQKDEHTAIEIERSRAGQHVHGAGATSPALQVNGAAVRDSKRATFLDPEPASSRLCAAGNVLVVPRDSVLPALCVKCGNTPNEPWVRITFSWHHPGYYFLIISPIIYVIVALIVRKRIKVSIPLCKTHKSIRRKRLWIAAILLIGCIPLPAALAVYVGNDAAGIVSAWLGIGMFIAGLFFLAYAPPLKAIKIGSASAEFKGACQEFLTSLGAVATNQS